MEWWGTAAISTEAAAGTRRLAQWRWAVVRGSDGDRSFTALKPESFYEGGLVKRIGHGRSRSIGPSFYPSCREALTPVVAGSWC